MINSKTFSLLFISTISCAMKKAPQAQITPSGSASSPVIKLMQNQDDDREKLLKELSDRDKNISKIIKQIQYYKQLLKESETNSRKLEQELEELRKKPDEKIAKRSLLRTLSGLALPGKTAN